MSTVGEDEQKVEENEFLPPSQNNKVNGPECYCGTSMAKTVNIKCTKCLRHWHSECVGLIGVTLYLVNKLENWQCPRCFKFSDNIVDALGDSEVDQSKPEKQQLEEIVRRGIKSMVPEIVSGVVQEIKTTKIDDIVKEAGQSVTKSWSDIAKTDQKKLIKDVVEASSESALQQSMKLIDSNLTERQKRKRNMIVSNIPENSAGGNLKQVVVLALSHELTVTDILFCQRLGKKGAKPRVILVVMRKEDDAVYFTNNGRGRRYYLGDRDYIWVNPDLTRTEREALYKKRVDKKSSRDEAAPPQPTAGEEVRSDDAEEVSTESTIEGVITGQGDGVEASARRGSVGGDSSHDTVANTNLN